jgi:hypothetical protein
MMDEARPRIEVKIPGVTGRPMSVREAAKFLIIVAGVLGIGAFLAPFIVIAIAAGALFWALARCKSLVRAVGSKCLKPGRGKGES